VLGGIVTLAFLFVPGMRDVERTGELARASLEPERGADLTSDLAGVGSRTADGADIRS